MRPISLTLVLALAFSGATQTASAQTGASEPYKLGTFRQQGRTFVGVVLRDIRVMDLAKANAAYEGRTASAKKLTMPGDMIELINRYEELKPRLSALATEAARAANPPAYVLELSALDTLPPVRPSIILNAGANYTEHAQGIEAQARRAGQAAAPPPRPSVSAPGLWERRADDTRDNPYLFLKSPTTVIGAFDPIRMPRGRDRIDFECELDVVIGKTADHVPIDRALDHIFGYTIQIDVSDRGGRGDSKMGGPDWLVGKNHDTFGPIGPFIVPKEFVADPHNVRQTFTLNGQVMQDSNTSRMTHNFFELLHFSSNNLTLSPGDLISAGSPAGTNIERAEPRWMRAGDNAVCTLEGIGTQKHAV
ncbi:MAG TPA: fumarylacetoacetate hydrolase family protein, partial [Vicinamibacteria bacterium]|nr:fumarylacetoacetate hydrolase family protein [Vicinamibacteria bacterium]